MGKNKNYRNKRKITYIVAIVVSVLLIGAGYYFLIANKPESQESTTTGNQSNSSTNGSTGVENDPVLDENKANIDNNQNGSTSSSGKKVVEPVITFAGVRNDNVDVRSYVSGVYETTGKCTVKFKNNGSEISRTVEGIKDVSYTRCDRVVIPKSEFKGLSGWVVTVTYSSSTANGESEPSEVNGL